MQIGQRKVCKHVFRLRFPVSVPTLNRCIVAKRNSLERYAERPGFHRAESTKSMYVIAWWLNYAKKTSEKLPDSSVIVTPRRHMVCPANHYCSTHGELRCASPRIPSLAWGQHVSLDGPVTRNGCAGPSSTCRS